MSRRTFGRRWPFQSQSYQLSRRLAKNAAGIDYYWARSFLNLKSGPPGCKSLAERAPSTPIRRSFSIGNGDRDLTRFAILDEGIVPRLIKYY
jgi:hypothetical protein